MVNIGCLNFKETVLITDEGTESNLSFIDGNYASPVDTFVYNSLVDNLILNYQSKYGEFDINDSVYCSLSLMNNELLEVVVFRNGEIDMGFKFKGEVENNFFYLEPQKYIESYFGFIFRLIEKRRVRIAVLADGNLLLNTKSLYTSSMFLIRGRHFYEESGNLVFERMNNEK